VRYDHLPSGTGEYNTLIPLQMTGPWWPEFSEQHGLRAVRVLERGVRFSRKA
jgi:hypothetical protein